MIRIIAASFFIFSVSLAGTMNGGGGKGLVCNNPDNNSYTVEILDFWEAQVLYNRKIKFSDEPLELQVMAGLERLQNLTAVNLPYGPQDNDPVFRETEFRRTLLKNARELLDPGAPRVKRLRDVNLTLTPDSFEEVTPAKCTVTQLVTYKDHVGILWDADRIDKLTATSKAGLILHEALYAYLRSYGYEPDSVRVRRAIGYIFSEDFKPFPQLRNFFEGKPYVLCKSASDDKKPTPGMTKRHSNIYFYEHNGTTVGLVGLVAGILPLGQTEPIDFWPGNLKKNYELHLATSDKDPRVSAEARLPFLSSSVIDFDLRVEFDSFKKPEIKNYFGIIAPSHRYETFFSLMKCDYYE